MNVKTRHLKALRDRQVTIKITIEHGGKRKVIRMKRSLEAAFDMLRRVANMS